MRCHATHSRLIKAAGLFAGLIVLFTLVGKAWAPPPPPGSKSYTTSAHGESATGVKRTADELQGYARGNCAHCHEAHASIGGVEPDPDNGAPSRYLVFAPTTTSSQTDNFCFNCHTGVGSRQTGGITNNNYGATFGGGPAVSTSIYNAFNPTTGSSHGLAAISTKIQGSWGAKFNAYSNPCRGCHNPHLAKKNNTTGAAYDPTQAAISRPTDPDGLWGNGAAERMNVYVGANTYRAPFSVGANPAVDPTLHEPDGMSRSIFSAEVQGSTTPDYNTFCLDCHAGVVGSYVAINWANDWHGLKGGNNSDLPGRLKAPYTTDGTSAKAEDLTKNFVLSCLDCHEPHGIQEANNKYLLRTTVNGVTGITFADQTTFYNFCSACHVVPHGDATMGCNSICHKHGRTF